MLKNNKGITMIALVITIIILLVLTGISVNTGFSTIKEFRAGRVISNLTMVKAKAEVIYEEYQFNGTPLVGTTGEKIELSDEEKRLLGSDFDIWTWYQWDTSILEEQGLDKEMLGTNEYFLVNYENAEIVYTKGTSLDGQTTYYSLTGLKYMLENS